MTYIKHHLNCVDTQTSDHYSYNKLFIAPCHQHFSQSNHLSDISYFMHICDYFGQILLSQKKTISKHLPNIQA